MSRVRRLRLVRGADEDYGFSYNNEIHINIQRIWNETRNVHHFAKEFSNTHTHELLHIIFTQVRPKRIIGEEIAIRKLLNESWNRSIAKAYTDQLN